MRHPPLRPGKLPRRDNLERHFDHRLIFDAGDVDILESHAQQLRLRVEKEELPLVLDCIASKGMVGIHVDGVEHAVNSLPGEEWFIEPER